MPIKIKQRKLKLDEKYKTNMSSKVEHAMRYSTILNKIISSKNFDLGKAVGGSVAIKGIN